MYTSSDADATRSVVTRYLESKHQDRSALADDVVFTNMATGEVHSGPNEVLDMLHGIYHVVFDADAEVKTILADGNRAVLEADFVGTHIGEFAGIPATGKHVRVPLCVVYEVGNDQIRSARIYFQVPALLAQLQ